MSFLFIRKEREKALNRGNRLESLSLLRGYPLCLEQFHHIL